MIATITHQSESAKWQKTWNASQSCQSAGNTPPNHLENSTKFPLHMLSQCASLHAHSSSANKSKVTANLQNIYELFARLVMSALRLLWLLSVSGNMFVFLNAQSWHVDFTPSVSQIHEFSMKSEMQIMWCTCVCKMKNVLLFCGNSPDWTCRFPHICHVKRFSLGFFGW